MLCDSQPHDKFSFDVPLQMSLEQPVQQQPVQEQPVQQPGSPIDLRWSDDEEQPLT
jgi:hypothetical protein